MFNRKYIFRWWMFHCHVSFLGGGEYPQWCWLQDFFHSYKTLLVDGGSKKNVFFVIPMQLGSISSLIERVNKRGFDHC